jgi:hypothetical protein
MFVLNVAHFNHVEQTTSSELHRLAAMVDPIGMYPWSIPSDFWNEDGVSLRHVLATQQHSALSRQLAFSFQTTLNHHGRRCSVVEPSIHRPWTKQFTHKALLVFVTHSSACSAIWIRAACSTDWKNSIPEASLQSLRPR